MISEAAARDLCQAQVGNRTERQVLRLGSAVFGGVSSPVLLGRSVNTEALPFRGCPFSRPA